MHRAPARLAALLAVVALTLGLGPSGAHATTTPPGPAQPTQPGKAGSPLVTFGIGPASSVRPDDRPYISAGVAPGSTVMDHVAVYNQSSKPLQLLVYAGDSLNTTGGGLDITKRTDRNQDFGAWVTLGAAASTGRLDPTSRSQVRVTVPPQSSERGVGVTIVPVRISVPRDASPGDHVGGIAASLITLGSGPTAQNVELEQRVVARVYLQVAGDLKPQLSVKVLKASYEGGSGLGLAGEVTVRYRITNTGNTRLGAATRVQVKGVLGLGSHSVDGPKAEELVPGGSADLTAVVPDVPPTVFATAKVTVQAVAPPGAAELRVAPASATSRIWAVTWQELVLLLLFVLITAGGFYQRQRRKRNPSPKGKHASSGGQGKRVQPARVHRKALGAGFVATVLVALLAAPALAENDPNTAGAVVIGKVFVEPSTGTDTTLFHGAVGEARCPKGTDLAYFDIVGEDIGVGASKGSQDMGFLGQPPVAGVGTVEFPNNVISNLRTTNAGAFSASGTYRVRLRCERGPKTTHVYETKLAYTAGGGGRFRVLENGARPTTPAATPKPVSGPGTPSGASPGVNDAPGQGGAGTPGTSGEAAAPGAGPSASKSAPATIKVRADGTAEPSKKSGLLLTGFLGGAGVLALIWVFLGRRRKPAA